MNAADLRRVLSTGIAIVGLIASTSLAAHNLLQNPGFATVLDPWQPFNGFGQTTVLSNFDANGDPNSGSAFVTIPANSTFRQPPAAQQCVAITPNTTYVYGGKAYLPNATTVANGNDVFASAQFFPAPNCAGNVDVFDFSAHVSTRDTWLGMLGVITSGASDVSVQIYPYLDAAVGTTVQLYFDDMFLLPDAIFRGTFN